MMNARTPDMTVRSGLDALQRILARQRHLAMLAGLPVLANVYSAQRRYVLGLDMARALKGARR